MKTLPTFSIDVKASGKEQMKWARAYLREQGYAVIKRKNDITNIINQYYLSNKMKHSKNVFEYWHYSHGEVLILPRDKDRLIEIVKGKKPEQDELFEAIKNIVVLFNKWKDESNI